MLKLQQFDAPPLMEVRERLDVPKHRPLDLVLEYVLALAGDIELQLKLYLCYATYDHVGF